MSRLQVFTDKPIVGGDMVYLDALAPVTDLHYSFDFPGGASAASLTLNADGFLADRALTLGRHMSITCGASVIWTGTLDEPERGKTWQVRATGVAAEGKNYRAVSTAAASGVTPAGNALAINNVMVNAESRGLRWNNRVGATLLPQSYEPSGSIDVCEAWSRVASGLNMYWWVDSASLDVAQVDEPFTVSYILMATDPGGSRTLNEFVTAYVVRYVNESTRDEAIVTVTNSTAEGKFGAHELDLDITDRGPISAANATTIGNNYLAKMRPRARYAGSFTATPGQLLNAGGTAVDLATVTPGALMQVLLTDPDRANETDLVNSLLVVVGSTEYDVDADVLTLTALDAPGKRAT